MRNINQSIILVSSFGSLLNEIQEYYHLARTKAKGDLPSHITFEFKNDKHTVYVRELRSFYWKVLSDNDVSIQDLSFFQFAESEPSEKEYYEILYAMNELEDALLDDDEKTLLEILNAIENQFPVIEEICFNFMPAKDYEYHTNYYNYLKEVAHSDYFSSYVELIEDERLDKKIKENKYNTGESTTDEV